MKIDVYYCRFGAGHQRAAHYINTQLMPHHNICLHDLIGELWPTASTAIYAAYKKLVRIKPIAKRIFSTPRPDTSSLGLGISRLDRIANRFLHMMDARPTPDAFIATYSMAAFFLSWYKRVRGLSTPLITCVTDFKVHDFWINDNCDLYLVASAHTKDELIARGVDAEKIVVHGIVFTRETTTELEMADYEAFLKKQDASHEHAASITTVSDGDGVLSLKALHSLGLPTLQKLQQQTARVKSSSYAHYAHRLQRIVVPGIMTRQRAVISTNPNAAASTSTPQLRVLITGGGLGLLPYRVSFYRTLATSLNAQVRVICGKNEALRTRLLLAQIPQVEVFGYVSNMPEHMQWADVVVGKPGGMSVLEAIDHKTPLLYLSPSMPQEQGNAAFIDQAQIGVQVDKHGNCCRPLSADTLQSMRDNMALVKAQNTPDQLELWLAQKTSVNFSPIAS